MIDINYYINVAEHKQRIMSGDYAMTEDHMGALMDGLRSKDPFVYNIETTNACNMRCPFCPRTELMTRPVKTMTPSIFQTVVEQLKPHSEKLWNYWTRFAEKTYGISPKEQSENAFFLYVIPKVITLHGYGDPLLDPHIADYVKLLTDQDIPSYFSCNPANINLKRTEKAFENGLGYIKYSIDSLDKSVRGIDAFEKDYPRILSVLDMKEKGGYKTQVVICMINLGQDQFKQLKDYFRDVNVYIYQKSPDQAWLTGGEKPQSIHWREFCQFPWSSMTIKSDGKIASCPEDYNNEIILGDVRTDTLFDIWNGEAYREFRMKHVTATGGIRCTDGRCDMHILGRLYDHR